MSDVDLVERELRGFGYSVARNDPYKGVQLIERIGQPHLHRHSLQVEIRRPLYMDEATREPNEGFVRLQDAPDANNRDFLDFYLQQMAQAGSEVAHEFHRLAARDAGGVRLTPARPVEAARRLRSRKGGRVLEQRCQSPARGNGVARAREKFVCRRRIIVCLCKPGSAFGAGIAPRSSCGSGSGQRRIAR